MKTLYRLIELRKFFGENPSGYTGCEVKGLLPIKKIVRGRKDTGWRIKGFFWNRKLYNPRGQRIAEFSPGDDVSRLLVDGLKTKYLWSWLSDWNPVIVYEPPTSEFS